MFYVINHVHKSRGIVYLELYVCMQKLHTVSRMVDLLFDIDD